MVRQYGMNYVPFIRHRNNGSVSILTAHTPKPKELPRAQTVNLLRLYQRGRLAMVAAIEARLLRSRNYTAALTRAANIVSPARFMYIVDPNA